MYSPQFVNHACLLGRFHKLPFPPTQSISLNPLSQYTLMPGAPLHMFPQMVSDILYSLLLIVLVIPGLYIPMKNKNEVFSYFQSLFAFVKNQFSLSIQVLRTDRGGEYMSNKFKDFLIVQGIIHQVSCPHTPEQNAILLKVLCISERKNRHIRETAVTMIQTTSLFSIFWYHACALVTYLINRMPTPNQEWMTVLLISRHLKLE